MKNAPLPDFDNVRRTLKFKQLYPKGFGVLTGKPHLGIDYVVPVGTPIIAWEDNISVVNSFYGSEGGNTIWCRVAGRMELVRFLHLRELPKNGTYNKGSIIGYTGNTGTSSAPHTHIDVSVNGNLELTHLNNFIDPDIYFESFKTEDMKITKNLGNAIKRVFGDDLGNNANDNEQDNLAKEIENLFDDYNLSISDQKKLVAEHNKFVVQKQGEIDVLNKKILDQESALSQVASDSKVKEIFKLLVETMRKGQWF